jgi:anti-sigma B factor antagonist
METAIGVFSSRERAGDAVQQLLQANVPEDSIVFLTRCETEAERTGKHFGATIGGFVGMATGMSAGITAATLLLPGVGPVFALGFGAAALLGLTGVGAGAAVGKAVAEHTATIQPTPDQTCAEDVAFFREVLRDGRSLVIVRTESRQTARAASEILDRMCLAIQGRVPVPMKTSTHQVADVVIVDVSGRITVGEGNVALREIVRNLIESGNKKIILNLHEVGYVDSSGLGELVKTYTSVRNQGGQLKLVAISKRVHDLLLMTGLYMVFDIQPDQASAIQSFSGPSASQAVA